MEKKQTLKTLEIKDKIKVINEVKRGVKRKREIADEYGTPASTLSTILKNAEKYLNSAGDLPIFLQRKRLKHSSLPELEAAMTEWLRRVRDHGLHITGQLITEKALEFAKEFGISFKGSHGWLENFKLRNGLVEKIISGESSAVSESDCQEYRDSILSELIKNYDPKDIFNMDELGLFWKCLPDRTITYKGDKCHGGKKSKERVTVLVAANMNGTEKLKMLVIGKYGKPRCFAGIQSLPVEYFHNRTAWMNSTIYESWLHKIDARFTREGRKVLLFVDNCPAHPQLLERELKSIKVEFLPPNTTSKLQPMDQGIIRNLKHWYRSKLMKRNLRRLDNGEEVTSMNLLEAICFLHQSWELVSESTIVNCFRKAGFVKEISTEDERILEEEAANEEIPHEWLEYQQCFPAARNIEYHQFLDVDADVVTNNHRTDDEILNATLKALNSNEDQVSEEEGAAPTLQTERTSRTEGYDGLDKVRKRIMEQAEMPSEAFSALHYLENLLQQMDKCKPQKQVKMTDCLNACFLPLNKD